MTAEFSRGRRERVHSRNSADTGVINMDRPTRDDDTGAVPRMAAVCGLFCEACSIYLAGQEDPERLAHIAARFGQTPEETYCEGCRAERRAVYCRSCALFACAAERGLDFCSECPDYPCAELETFGRERPHRANIFEDLHRIGEIGAEAWMEEARRRYTCPSCGTINSAYDLACRRCGREPANAYVQQHRTAILKRLAEM
jgi:Protein of unknown function (DUF3795)